MRGDTGSGVEGFLWHIYRLGMSYSVGVYGRHRDGAQVAELTRWLPVTLVDWPPGMRVIARREWPHSGAQLRITDGHGSRITVFTATTGGRLADLEVRHRMRARAKTASEPSKTPA